jgi:hypothetical protein
MQSLGYIAVIYWIYRVYQEERSIFKEIIISVILRKEVYMNM